MYEVAYREKSVISVLSLSKVTGYTGISRAAMKTNKHQIYVTNNPRFLLDVMAAMLVYRFQYLSGMTPAGHSKVSRNLVKNTVCLNTRLNARQSEIFADFRPKVLFKPLKSILSLFRNVKRF